MEKIKKLMIKAAQIMGDKNMHAIVNFIIVCLFGNINIILGICLAVLASLLKEVYDADHEGIFDTQDLFADLIGIILGLCVLLV